MRFRYKNATITLSDGLDRWVERAIRHTAPAVFDAIELETEAVYDVARANWPVKTGRSRDGLAPQVGYDLGTSRLSGAVINTASKPEDGRKSYVYFIKAPLGGTGKPAHVVTALLRRPFKAAAKRLARELGPALRRAWGG